MHLSVLGYAVDMPCLWPAFFSFDLCWTHGRCRQEQLVDRGPERRSLDNGGGTLIMFKASLKETASCVAF